MLIRSRIANVTHSTNRIYLYLSKDWAYSSSSGIRFQVSLEVLPFVFPFRFVSCYCPRVHKNPTNKYHCPRTILASNCDLYFGYLLNFANLHSLFATPYYILCLSHSSTYTLINTGSSCNYYTQLNNRLYHPVWLW